MNLDLFRLALLGSRRSWGRPIGIVLGIAVGVALLLTLLGAANGLQNRDRRTGWLNILGQYGNTDGGADDITDDSALMRIDVDYFRGDVITRRDIATTSTTSLRWPWGANPPLPGTYLASPALIKLINSVPSDVLGDRYGTLAGVIPDTALASPDALVVLIGQPVAVLQGNNPGQVVYSLDGFRNGANPVYRSTIIVGGIAMFLPVLLFVSIVTQLGAAQRSERFATFRQIGADSRIVVRLAAVEMAGLSLVGALLGVVGWRFTRPIAASFSIDDGSFYGRDLALSPLAIVIVVLGAVVAATIVAGWRMGRAGIGPLGASREIHESRPSFLRILPLLGGIGSIVLATRIWKNSAAASLIELMLIGGFTLTAIGIVLVGPWLTSIFSRIAMKRVRSAAGVIAASRIRQHPAATFRSVSGLVLGVFVASVFAGAASSVLDERDPAVGPGLLPLTALSATVRIDSSAPLQEGELDRLLVQLRSIQGVTAATAAWVDSDDTGLAAIPLADARTLGLAADLTSPYVELEIYRAIYSFDSDQPFQPTPVQSLGNRTPAEILVGTDGSPGALERARTVLEGSPTISTGAFTRGDLADRSTRRFVNSMATLAYIGIAITILIAGISLSVATAASILDRKRIFGLLRLVGMPARTLRDIVVIEAVVPLMAVVAISIGFGFLVAWLIVEGLSTDRSMHWPDGRYVLTILLSTLMAAGAVAATLGIVRANTTVSQTRFE